MSSRRWRAGVWGCFSRVEEGAAAGPAATLLPPRVWRGVGVKQRTSCFANLEDSFPKLGEYCINALYHSKYNDNKHAFNISSVFLTYFLIFSCLDNQQSKNNQ